MDLDTSVELVGTRDGLSQLQRRWRPPSVRAAMVLVHGIAEHSGRYNHLGRYLAERGVDVLAADTRGHGQSGGRRGHIDRFDELLDDVEDLVVERRRLDVPVVLLGHSLGGLIASSYVVAGRPAPDLLVLSAPALDADAPRWQRPAAPLLSRLVPRLVVGGAMEPTRLSRDPGVQESYRDDPLRLRGVTARLGHEVFSAMTTTSADLERITMPTYVLHGVDDELVLPEVSRPLNALANVTYRLWPGLRHECFNEPEQEDVLAALMAWLDEQLISLAAAAREH